MVVFSFYDALTLHLVHMQYVYWEKVKHVDDPCRINPSLSLRPLMRNWTDDAARIRDTMDCDHGRGEGPILVTIHVSNIICIYIMWLC